MLFSLLPKFGVSWWKCQDWIVIIDPTTAAWPPWALTWCQWHSGALLVICLAHSPAQLTGVHSAGHIYCPTAPTNTKLFCMTSLIYPHKETGSIDLYSTFPCFQEMSMQLFLLKSMIYFQLLIFLMQQIWAKYISTWSMSTRWCILRSVIGPDLDSTGTSPEIPNMDFGLWTFDFWLTFAVHLEYSYA